jgi:putative membrane protein
MSRRQTGKRIMTFAVAALFAGAVAMAQQPNSPQNPQNQQNQPQMPGQSSSGNPNYPEAGTPGAQGSMSQTFADQMFVTDTLEHSAAEAQMSVMAEQKSPSPDVKQFGQRMVLVHNQLVDQMKPVADQLGVKDSPKPTKKQEKEIAQLQTLSGPDFDRAYIQAMAKDQKRDVKEFKTEANAAQTPAVKQAASMDAPVLEQHLQILQQLAQNHNVTIAEK